MPWQRSIFAAGCPATIVNAEPFYDSVRNGTRQQRLREAMRAEEVVPARFSYQDIFKVLKTHVSQRVLESKWDESAPKEDHSLHLDRLVRLG